MADLAALDDHTCPACGARAEWSPGRQALVCPYCGTVAPGTRDPATGKIEEIDLARTLRELPDELRGWQTARQAVRCARCRAVSVFEPGRIGQRCDFCGSPELVAYDEVKAPLRPQSLVPFCIELTRAREHVRRWAAGRWFAPAGFRRRALVDGVRGVYLPYWTFDAAVRCPWSADSGVYYYTSETYRDGSGRARTRRVRHVRWQPASGEIEHSFDDEPVPGTQGADVGLLRRIEPFPASSLVPYDTGYLSGFVVEHYQVVLVEAARRAREAMNDKLRALAAAEVPGDTHRNLQIDPRYSHETFKLILVPVWLLACTHGGKTYQVLVNGSTGAIAGRYPKSPWKVLLVVAGALAIAAAWLLLAR